MANTPASEKSADGGRDGPDQSAADTDPVAGTPQAPSSPPLEDDPGFAPKEPTDGRARGDWKSRYTDSSAQRGIRIEACYVLLTHLACLAAMASVALNWPQDWFNLSDTDWARTSHWALAWLGGLLGGSLFAMKWMYHSVAKGLWNQDRRLWRIFTPLLSAGVGLTVVILSAARIIPLFGADLVATDGGAVGVAVLVGYFSDQTISRLADMAEGHLGKADRRDRLQNGTGADNGAGG